MDDKEHILETMREEFNRWETLLASLSEANEACPEARVSEQEPASMVR